MTHPTKETMSDRLPHQCDPETERQVRVRILIEGRTWFTRVELQQIALTIEPHSGTDYVLTLTLPSEVAEYYRQQGRRKLQGELRSLLNAESQL